MPAQPPVKEPEEEMEAEGESQLPEANGEVEEPRENEGTRGGGAEETMEESTEERETDLEDSDEEEEEEEEEESSGKKIKSNQNAPLTFILLIKKERRNVIDATLNCFLFSLCPMKRWMMKTARGEEENVWMR